MSTLNLREFNILSKKDNYFLTNNRKEGFPNINENSAFLKKILINKNSNDKITEIKGNELKTLINFLKQDKKLGNNEQLSISVATNSYNSNNIYNNQKQNRYNNKQSLTVNSHYKYNSKLIPNSDSNEENYNKIPINIKKMILKTPVIYKQNENIFSSTNINNSEENEIIVLTHKGKKIFNRNKTIFTPIKKNNRANITELYRNSGELNRKRETIYQRKIKRESSAIRKEMLKREKDKVLNKENLNNIVKTINNSINSSNSKNKNKIKIKKVNNITINDNNPKFKTKENNSSIDKKQSPIKTLYENSINNFIQSNNFKRGRIKKYKLNRNIYSKEMDNDSKIENQKIMNNNSCNSNSIFKTYNIYLSKGIEHSPQTNIIKFNINHKIKDNLNYLRNINTIPSKDINESFNYRICSLDKHNNIYNFSTSKKRFCEDYINVPETIYSNDKKISIKVHTLVNINEMFSGKKMTREKLRLQRVINIFIDNKNVNKLLKFRSNISKKVNEYRPPISIKEEEKVLSNQLNSKLIKAESENEIKKKPVIQKNIRMKYIRRIQNKK